MPHGAVTDAVRKGTDGSQVTPDEAAQDIKVPDGAQLPMDGGRHRSSADPAHSQAATPSTADLEPELPGLPSTEATAGADESADSAGLRAGTAPADSRSRSRIGAAAAGPAQSAAGAEGLSAPAAGRPPAVGSPPGSQAQPQGDPAPGAQDPLSAATAPAQQASQQQGADSQPTEPSGAAPVAGDPGGAATVSGSQDLTEEDEVMHFTAWVRERLQLQAQEVDALREDGSRGQATLAPSRREEDGPQMITGYSGRLEATQQAVAFVRPGRGSSAVSR